MQRPLKTGLAVVAAASLFAIGGVSSATAAKLITGNDIKNESVTGADIKNDSVGLKEFNPPTRSLVMNNKGDKGATGATGATGAKGDTGATGAKGDKGDSGLAGAYYAVAKYNAGDTNQGAVATVACSAQTDVAIAGGSQTLGLGADTAPAAVASSFPGRMDWTTNTPKADRLDGWIIQFDAANAPKKASLWALCVPGADIPVVTTYTQSD